MFLRFTKVRRGSAILEYASIAEREIVDKKQKTTTVKYLGPVKSQEDRERCRKIFEEYREAMKKFSLNDLTIKPTLSFGLFYASRMIMERNGILEVLKRNTGSYSEILSFMIISRLFDPSSDMELIDLAGRVFYPWELHISEDCKRRSRFVQNRRYKIDPPHITFHSFFSPLLSVGKAFFFLSFNLYESPLIFTTMQ